MQSSELEVRVLSAIEAIKQHRLGEDDMVEFKAEWPEPDKERFVRQLAGSLNRAAGETIVLVIGVDERTGEHFPWTGRELSTWWPSVQKHFDQALPELVRDRSMVIAGGKSIRALAISSDRAPYILKLGQSREILIREATGTRPAARDEILRMLVPAMQIPSVDVLRIGATLEEDHGNPDPDSDDDGGIYFTGWADIFVEHTFSRSSVMFPRHRIKGEIEPLGIALKISSPGWGIPEQTVLPGHEGVVERTDGFIVSGPGTMRVRFRSELLDWEKHKQIFHADFLHLALELPVSGTNRSVHIDQVLRRHDEAIRYTGSSTDPMAHWSYSF